MLIELKNDLRIRYCFVIHFFNASVGMLISFILGASCILLTNTSTSSWQVTLSPTFTFRYTWHSHRNPRRKWREVPSLTVCDIYFYPWLCCQVFVLRFSLSKYFYNDNLQIRALVEGWCRHRHFAGNFPNLHDSAVLPGFLVLTASSRIQLVRKQNAMPLKLLERSSLALAINIQKLSCSCASSYPIILFECKCSGVDFVQFITLQCNAHEIGRHSDSMFWAYSALLIKAIKFHYQIDQ